MPASQLVKVALPVPLRRLFDYRPLAGELPAIGCRCRVPFGKRELVGLVVAHGEPSGDYDPAKLQLIAQQLDDEPLLAANLMMLLTRAADYYQQPIGEMMMLALPTLLRQGRPADHATENLWRLTDRGRHLLAEQFKQAHRQQAAWDTLLQHPQGLSSSALRALGVQPAALSGLARRGWAEEVAPGASKPSLPLLAETALSANDEQQAAIDTIQQSDGFQGYLLDGVTGSGKTEVYLQAAADTLAAGKQVLILVPEIGLTPQTVERFRRRFNRPVEALHSGLSDPQRLAIWAAARDGRVDIVMGTRSALFTPLPRLGLLIVDEAHDSSFKQQDGCRYHARDLALWRGKLEQLPVVLGSATPSLESLELATQQRLTHLPLRQRAGDAQAPQLKLLDCRNLSGSQLLHPQSQEAIATTLAAGKQALVFLNRRGYAPLINCLNCGWQMECLQCNSFMTWHKQLRRLICHHCDSQKPVPRHCPDCGSSQLGDIGVGTEKLEELLQQQFADYAVIRIDRDATRRKGSLEAKLAQVHSGQPAVLIGTQMLAKGHHFPKLATTVIVDADAGFLSADFRGAEHAGETILQVAGRTGRGDQQGHVFIQTRHPDLPALECLLSGDWHQFAQRLRAERQLLGLPPFGHAALLSAEAAKAQAANQFLLKATGLLEKHPQLQRLGPAPAPREKRAGRYRFQLLLLSSERASLQLALRQLVTQAERWPSGRRCRWSIDVDPQDML